MDNETHDTPEILAAAEQILVNEEYEHGCDYRDIAHRLALKLARMHAAMREQRAESD